MATDNEILIKIKADSDKALKEIKSLNTQINKLSTTSKKSAKDVALLSKSFNSLGVNLSAAAAGFLAYQGATKAISTLADFETAMKKLGAVSGATNEELKALEQTALDLGESTQYSATQAAEGMNFLAMAGFSAEEAITAIPSVLNLATVGSLDLATASDIASDSMTAFGLEADEMSRITDVMAKTITSSNTTVEMLGDSFKKVAPVSASLGVSLEETSAALGVLADAGIKSALAGTQLKITLLRLATDEGARKAMEKLGVSAFDAEGNFKGLAKITSELKPKLNALSQEARTVALKDIAGSEAVAGFTTLINQTETLTSRTKELADANGESERLAKEMSDTLAIAWKEVESAIEGVILASRDELLPLLKQMAKETSEWIRSIDKDAIADFAKGIKEIVGHLGTLISVMQKINDIAMWDGFGGKDATILGHLSDKLSSFIGTIDLYIDASDRAEKATLKYIEQLENTTKANNEVIESSEASRKEIEKRISATDSLLVSMSDNLSALEDEANEMRKHGISTDAHEATILQLKFSLKELTSQYIDLTEVKAKDIETTEKQTKSTKKLATGLDDLTKAQEKSLQKTIETYTKREISAQKTLDSLLSKEKKLASDLEALERGLHTIRQNYANKRNILEVDVSSKIANVNAKALDSYQSYKDAQRRADIAYQNAKDALASGDIELAKRYQSEYDSLISQSAGDEIVVNEKIRATKAQTAAEFQRDAIAGKDLTLGIYALEEAEEIKAHNIKIANKQAEIALIRIQLVAQKALLTSLGEIVAKATGAKFDMDFTEVDNAIADLDRQIADTTSKKREIEIETKAETKPAEQELDTFEKEEEQKPVIKIVKMDLKTAEENLVELQKKAESDTSAKHTAKVASAIQAIAKLQALASKDTYSTHYVTTVQTNATGGAVGFFAEGGGFAKRSGKIPGHDLAGSDDVPSMLTRGEFVQKVRAVDYYGVDFMKQLNNMQIPKSALHLADGGLADTNPTKNVNLSLMMPDNKTSFNMTTDDQIASALEKYMRKNQ